MYLSYSIPLRGPILVFLLYSARALADEGDDTVNNLFSDLSPLIVLFGEQVTKQYLSQSMYLLEHVIFACAPLGIIAAITCAIRVAGNKTMRAIIGRAREPEAQAEIEIMSSTSSSVCELWNGVGLVRLAGSPEIAELLYDRERAGIPEVVPTDSEHRDSFCGVYEVSQVMKRPSIATQGGEPESGRLAGRGSVDEKPAPNISLNTSNIAASKWELRIIAFIGLILQCGVLVFDVVSVYYPGWKWKKGGKVVASYAFPLNFIGTLGVALGMFICAYVVEASTEEQIWEFVNPALGKRLQILWLQRGQTVNDQRFKSYAIYATKTLRTVTASNPSLKKSNNRRLKLLTNVGAVVSVLSFVLQFIGIRAMHFSASLAQLIATFIMTALRVFIRRSLSMEPQLLQNYEIFKESKKSYAVQELPEHHELDFIANQMCGRSSWNIITTGYVGSFSIVETSVSRVFQARLRLGMLAKTAWKVEMDPVIITLTETIEALMNHLRSSSEDTPYPAITRIGNSQIFDWSIAAETYIGTDPQDQGSIKLSLERRWEEGIWWPWKANQADIEAVFSLWMSHLRVPKTDQSPPQDQGANLWLLGPSADGSNPGRVLCDWWISRETDLSIKVTNVKTTQKNHGISELRTFYCAGSRRGSTKYHGIINTTSLSQMCAQYLLSVFMAAVARSIGPINPETTFRSVPGKRLLKILNPDVRALVEIVEKSHLASFDDAYRIIVIALHEADKLPSPLDGVPKILEIARDFAQPNKDLYMTDLCGQIGSMCVDKAGTMKKQDRWGEAGDLYIRVLRSFRMQLGQEAKEVVQFGLLMRNFCQEFIAQCTPSSSPNAPTVAKFIGTFGSSYTDQSQFPIHEAIRDSTLHNLLRQNLTINIEGFDDELKTPLGLAASLGKTDSVRLLLLFGANPAAYDGNDKTALHHAAGTLETVTDLERTAIVKLLLRGGADIDDQKKSETPLQVAAAAGDEEIVKLLVQKGASCGSKDGLGRTAAHRASGNGNLNVIQYFLGVDAVDFKVPDNEGTTAMHMAAHKGNSAMIELLAKKSIVEVTDNNGRTPMHRAAEMGHEDSITSLISHGANIRATDTAGKTPLHTAAENGHTAVLKLLMKNKLGKGDLESKDILGRTAAHYAAKGGHVAPLNLLLRSMINPDIRDKEGQTAVHLAVGSGHREAVSELVANGASVFIKDLSGRTAMHTAAEGGYRDILELVGTSLDPDIQKNDGQTALHLAAINGHLPTANFLLDTMDADPDVRDNTGRTALWRAAEKGNDAFVQYLIKAKANPRIKDNDGRTAMHAAARGGHTTIIKTLLEHGMNLGDNDNSGRTATDLAAEKGILI